MKHAQQLILGNILTYDTDRPYAEAMAVLDGKIIYVGAKDVAERFCDASTVVHDYGTCTVYPGFMDAHCHGVMAGQRLVFDCKLTGKCMEDYAAAAGKLVRDNPGRKFYCGAGWEKYAEPTRQMLDEVTGDNPVFLTSIDGHSKWLNTAALKACNITAETAKEFGYDLIHVDSEGNPSGLVCEKATSLTSAFTMPTKEMVKEGLLAWQEFAFSQGMTAVVEAMPDLYTTSNEAYSELVKEGKWKLRTYAYPTYMKNGKADYGKVPDRIREDREKYNSEYYQIVGLKIFIDGVVEAHTASLIDEYCDQPGYHGVNYMTGKEEDFNKAVAAVNAAGFPVHFHTIGDLAVKTAMDAVEYSELTNCNLDIRNALAHLQVVSENDVRRIADYNAVAVVAPCWSPVVQPYFGDEINFLGEERAWHAYPVRSFEDAGATICYHTDYPVSPEMDAKRQIYTGAKREKPERKVISVRNPEETVGVLRSLLAMTANIAYMLRKQDTLGKLEIGKIANCTVYDTNFLTCDTADIANAKLVATVVDGEEVFRA